MQNAETFDTEFDEEGNEIARIPRQGSQDTLGMEMEPAPQSARQHRRAPIYEALYSMDATLKKKKTMKADTNKQAEVKKLQDAQKKNINKESASQSSAKFMKQFNQVLLNMENAEEWDQTQLISFQ